MKNCFFCNYTECSQAGIDGMWGDGCAMDPEGVVVNGNGEEDEEYEEEDEAEEDGKDKASRPRNCDVGTAKEQYDRFRAFCSHNYHSAYIANACSPCEDCPLADCFDDGESDGCEFAWAQMPYEEGGAEC